MAAVTIPSLMATASFQEADRAAISDLEEVASRSIRVFPKRPLVDRLNCSKPVISDFRPEEIPDSIEEQIQKVYRSVYDEKEVKTLCSIYLKTKHWPLGVFILGGRDLSHSEVAENFGLIREDALGHVQYGSILAICGWTIQKNLVFLLGAIKRKADFHVHIHPDRFILDGEHPVYWKKRNEPTTFAIELAVLLQTGYQLTHQGKRNGLWLVLEDEKLAEAASLHSVRRIKENLTPKNLDDCLKARWKGADVLI